MPAGGGMAGEPRGRSAARPACSARRPWRPLLAAAALFATLRGAAPRAAMAPPARGKVPGGRRRERGQEVAPGDIGSFKTPWDEEPVSFSTAEEAKATLAQPLLLAKWARRARDVLAMSAYVSGQRLDTSSALRVATDLGPLHIYFIGETGGGKSTLINALADGITEKPVPVMASATTPTDNNDTAVPLPSGIVFVESRGNRIPVPPVAMDSPASFNERASRRYWYSRQLARWEYSLGRLRGIVEETDPDKLPAATVLYVHRAGTRMVVDRLVEILSVPHEHNVPVFFVLTDINSVDDAELTEIRRVMVKLVEMVGVNARGQQLQTLEVNSVPKYVQNVEFQPSGLPELVAALLNSLRPVDILQFTRRRPIYDTSGLNGTDMRERLETTFSRLRRQIR